MKPLKTRWKAVAAALAMFAAPAAATAQSLFADDAPPPAQAHLHAGWAEEEGVRIAAVRMELQPGWKTYWRSPGDSGIPPDFDWSGSENLADVRVAWPAPIAFDTYGSRTYGYEGRMTLPLRLTPKDPSKPIRLRLALFYGVCSDVCVPGREDLALDIAPGAAPEGAYFIRQAFEALPGSATAAGLVGATCELAMNADGEGDLSARLAFAEPLSSAPIVIAEGPKGVWFGQVETKIVDGALVADARMRAQEGVWLDRSQLRFTLLDGRGALQHQGCDPVG
ncbi:MAG: protein-disulfide reductase DsbD domain-containing protein [Pseudomonadota bacterium]